jgi:hypothetical protein
MFLAALASGALSLAAAAADLPSVDSCRMMKTAAAQAEQGNADAMEFLGSVYYSGECAEMNFSRAAEWYLKSAEKGSVKSQAAIGEMYLRGRGVAQNYKEAFRWLRPAAENGNADAEYSLAFMYLMGLGTGKNKEEALSWYGKACDSGISLACTISARSRFSEAASWAGPLKQQIELCYFDLGALSGAEPHPDTGATSCSSEPEDKARGTVWDIGKAVKSADNSPYVKSVSVENGVITLTTKNISLGGKDSFTLIWVPYPVAAASDNAPALNWKISPESTCLTAGLCQDSE